MSIAKRADVIQAVQRALELGTLIPSFHALLRMKRRDVQMSDIEEMLAVAQREEAKDRLSKNRTDWTYALRGPNRNGDKDIRIIVAFADEDIVIVTVIDKNK